MSLAPSPTWSSRFRARFALRTTGPFTLHAAHDQLRDRGCLLVLPHERHLSLDVAEVFAKVAEAHNAVQHHCVPNVVDWSAEGDVGPHLVFDVPDAVADGPAVLRTLSEAGERFTYGAADAFIATLREALQHAHATPRPSTRAPLCMGRISSGNLVFDKRGAFFLIGLGHNFITDAHDGSFTGEPACFQAPEVAMDRDAASPEGDYLALLLMMRSLLPMVTFPQALQKVTMGTLPGDSDKTLHECLVWFNANVYGAAPGDRVSIAEAVEVSTRIRDHLGLVLDPAGFRDQVMAVLSLQSARPNVSRARRLVIGPEGRWVRIDGEELKVSGRGPMRGILLALGQQRKTNPDGALSRDQLFAAGWPGQNIEERSRANRVYVALSTLRKLGFKDAIVHDGDGYRIAGDWAVELAHRAAA